MYSKLFFLIPVVTLFCTASSVQAELFSLGAAEDITLGNDARYGPDSNSNGSGLEARNIPSRRHVVLISYDISAIKSKGQFSNVSFSHFSHDLHGETNVYGVIESLDLLEVQSSTWNTAPGVQNDPTPALDSPIELDFADITDVLLTFAGPGQTGVRFSTDTSEALADFLNSDTDGIVTFLFAAGAENDQLIIRSMEHAEGGSFLEGELSSTLGIALNPNPADGDLHPDTWANLSWKAAVQAVSHDVYFGDNLDDVSSGAEGVFVGNQSATFIAVGFPGFAFPEGLVPGTTYYWRIDEVNDADPNSPWKGNVWSFSVPPKTAYNPDPPDGAEFVEPDATFTWAPGFGAKLHTVYIGTSFEDINDTVGGAPQGDATFGPGPLDLEKVYYWRVDEFDSSETHKGDIWSFTTPGAVGNAQPANGTVEVPMTATLSWTAADNAASHELYFGTDADAVKNATTASPEYVGPKVLGAESYDPGKLAWKTAYYWRVDEVYPSETLKGLVWSFETAYFLPVDDFESYNDIDPPDPNSNRIFDKWIDGFGTTTNGALVGNDLPPYAEQSVVHGGAQSMPYLYDNADKTSEATLTLAYPRDWTEEAVTKLSLWFRGASANAAERMFVVLGNSAVYHDDASATQITGWNEWVIDLQAFAGVDLTDVSAITIGFGTKAIPAAGGTGTMYFDDIRLYQ